MMLDVLRNNFIRKYEHYKLHTQILARLPPCIYVVFYDVRIEVFTTTWYGWRKTMMVCNVATFLRL